MAPTSATDPAGETSHAALAPASGDDLDEPLVTSGPTARTLGWVFVLAGLVGLVASGALAVERFRSLTIEGYEPGCAINAAVDCAPAMASWQGTLLGFPNPLLGIGAFPLVVFFGALLLSGVVVPDWMWRALLAGATAGLALVHFLMWASLVDMGVLCPWCTVVWVVTAPVFWYALVHVVEHSRSPARVRRWVVRNRFVVLVAWYVLVAAAVAIGLRHLW